MGRTRESRTLLTLPQLAELAGVGKRTLHVWVQKGLVRPSLQSSSGKGVPNLFAPGDVSTVKVLRELRQAGVGLDRLRLAADAMHEAHELPKEDAILVLNGTVEIRSEEESLSSALTGSGAALICRLPAVE